MKIVYLTSYLLIVFNDCASSCKIALQDGYTVESESGTKFNDVDLSEGEWVEYDEKLGDSVGIYELEHKFQPHH